MGAKVKDLRSLGSSKNYWSMCKKLKKVMEACGIEKALSFQSGSYSFGTFLINAGICTESIAKMMGHASIRSTRTYARLSDV